MTGRSRWSRRSVLRSGVALGGAVVLGACAGPRDAETRPVRPTLLTHGVQSGDVAADGALVWSRTDRPARMVVGAPPWSTTLDPPA